MPLIRQSHVPLPPFPCCPGSRPTLSSGLSREEQLARRGSRSGQRAPGPLPASSGATGWAGPGHGTPCPLGTGPGAQAPRGPGAATPPDRCPHLRPSHAGRPAVGLTGHAAGEGNVAGAPTAAGHVLPLPPPAQPPRVPPSHTPTLTARRGTRRVRGRESFGSEPWQLLGPAALAWIWGPTQERHCYPVIQRGRAGADSVAQPLTHQPCSLPGPGRPRPRNSRPREAGGAWPGIPCRALHLGFVWCSSRFFYF